MFFFTILDFGHISYLSGLRDSHHLVLPQVLLGSSLDQVLDHFNCLSLHPWKFLDVFPGCCAGEHSEDTHGHVVYVESASAAFPFSFSKHYVVCGPSPLHGPHSPGEVPLSLEWNSPCGPCWTLLSNLGGKACGLPQLPSKFLERQDWSNQRARSTCCS